MRLRVFASDTSANAAILFALTLPVVLGMAALAVEYGHASAAKAKMQTVADSAALAAAQELELAQSDPDRIVAVAESVVNDALPGAHTRAIVDKQAESVQVIVDKTYPAVMGSVVLNRQIALRVSATARMSGAMPLCLLGLDPSGQGTISLQKSALLTAPGCLVQSNSRNPAGIMSKDDAVLRAGLICSAGGKVQTRNASYSPAPLTDCPALPDPLVSRVAPTVGPCNYVDRVVSHASELLQPGVYCGGLTVTDNAAVTLARGIFIIKDGPLLVDRGASLSGGDVAIYLTGANANLTFDADTTISLSAPKDGPLAGILIFDDPSGASAPAKQPHSGRGAAGRAATPRAPRQHQILSDNARNLLGTLYMPQGQIIIDADKPIADKSAYTVLVVKRLNLYSGPNLVLNSDYTASDVPVPKGVGPHGGKVILSN